MFGKELYMARDSEIWDIRCRILTYENVLALDVSMAETFGMKELITLGGSYHKSMNVSLNSHLFYFFPEHLEKISFRGVLKKGRDSDGFSLLNVLALFHLVEMF